MADLAGMPKSVVYRAQAILKTLESKKDSVQKELSFPHKTSENLPIVSLLNTIDPNVLSPREALEILYKLKEKTSESCDV